MDIVIVLIDTLRFDCMGYHPDKRHLSMYNVDGLLETPTLDSMASRGVCFTHAFGTSTLTCPSISSILTGLYQPRHGVRIHGVDKLNGTVKTLPEILKKHGYTTILFSDNGLLFDIPGLSHAFDYTEFSANEEKLFSLLSGIKSANEPVLLVYHVMDVHAPYLYSNYELYKGYNDDFFEEMERLTKRLNKEFKKDKAWKVWFNVVNEINYDIERLLPLYVRGVTKFDKKRLSNFINNLNNLINLEENIFLFLSDHGEGKNQVNVYNKHFNHGGFLRDEVMCIPMILIHPDLRHRMYDNLVSTVDIVPTVLDFIDVNPVLPYNFDGVSLSTNDEAKGHQFVYSEVWLNDSADPLSVNEAALFQRCIRTMDKKYILYGRPEAIYMNPGYNTQFSDNSEFIKQLFKDLFYVVKPTPRMRGYIKDLNSATKSREEIFKDVMSTYRKHPKRFEVYDLSNDFLEEKPINPFKDVDSAIENSIYLNKILSISNSSLTGVKEKNVVPKATERTLSREDMTSVVPEESGNPQDKEAIIEKLRELGYF